MRDLAQMHELGRGMSSGRHFGEVAARPAPQIEGVFGALRPSVRARWIWRERELEANYATTQARDTDGMVWSNGFCGLNAQPPTDASQATLIVTCHPVLWRTTPRVGVLCLLNADTCAIETFCVASSR